MSIQVLHEDKSKVTLVHEDKKIDWTYNMSVRKKFKPYVTPFLEMMFKLAPQDKVNEYFNLLYDILEKEDKRKIDKWIDVIKDIVDSLWQDVLKEINVEFKESEEKTEMTVTKAEFEDLFRLSLALKLGVFIIHHPKAAELNLNANYVLDRLIKLFVKHETIDKIVKFISRNILNSYYNRESMWTYLKEVLGITPENHIQQTLNSFFRSMMTLYDPRMQDNVMSYLLGFVNQALYYLYTDTYERNVQFINLAKIKYIKTHSIIKQQAVLYLFEEIADFIKAMFNDYFSTDEEPTYDIACKVYKVKPYNIVQRGQVVNPITKYVTFPMMQYLFKADPHYFTEFKKLRLVEIYVSLIVENVLKLKYLAKLIRSIVIGKTKKKIKLNRIKIGELENLDFSLRTVFKEKRLFVNMISEIKSYKFYDPFIHDFYTIDVDYLIDELKQFYSYLWGPDRKYFKKLMEPFVIWYKQESKLQSQEIQLSTVF